VKIDSLSNLGKAGRHHPEEQGLKLVKRKRRKTKIPLPVGIIQKNKD